MTKLERIGSLEVEHDETYQRREWVAARLLLAVLVAVMAATGLGLFGGGVLSHARAGSPVNGFWVDYERFGRFGAQLQMSVHATPRPDQPLVQFSLPHRYLEAVRVISVTPQPAASDSTPDGVRFRFSAPAAAPMTVYFTLQPIRRWLVHGAVESTDARLEFSQFIYP